jgi:hypothetical protein
MTKKGYLCMQNNLLMKRLILFSLVFWTTLTMQSQQVIEVKKGDAQSLLAAIRQANTTNADMTAERTYIFIPDGLYDLGETVLTQITGHHIALIGESMRGTIIRNAPDYRNEGIGKTAVLQNHGTGNYFQDLTLQNALDYYACRPDGRAVTLHDKGTQTICNRVCLLSHQDTYYADNLDCQHYFQNSEIHGTVDFICGAGDVWFERCRIVTEKRTEDGSGRNVIAAPRTAENGWGFVFNYCTIENRVSEFTYARAWHTAPRCTWLHTTLLTPEKLQPTRFEEQGLRTAELDFKEYRTVDAGGRDVMPRSNIVTFTAKGKSKASETILGERQAKQFTRQNVFKPWNPVKVLKQAERESRKLKKRLHR